MCVFSLPISTVMIEKIYTLSYNHHQIGSLSYYPLFRVRSRNNGMRCMSLYILIDHLWQRLVMSSANILFSLLKSYQNVKLFISVHHPTLSDEQCWIKWQKSEHVAECWFTFQGSTATRTPQMARFQSNRSHVIFDSFFINIAQLQFLGHDLLRHHGGWFH